jgi:alkylhydroperoxidase/carboxymuconolactone decarboxylase family protein YurZ
VSEHELPRLYVMFRDDHPEIAEAFDALGSAAHEEGPLDERSRALVKLSLAVGAGLEGAVHAHVRKALDRGLTREEIVHAIVLALPTLGWPRMHSAWTWARDIFEGR